MNLLQRLLALIGGTTVKTEDDVVSFVQNLLESAKATMAAAQTRWDAENAAAQCDTAMPNSATPADALKALLGRLDAARTAAKTESAAAAVALANATTAQQTATATLLAFRKAAAEPLVTAAVAGGRVTPAKKDEALASLVNAATPEAFTTAAAALASAKPAMKVAATAGADRSRDTGVRDRQDKFLALVNARVTKNGEEYDDAFAAVRKENPAVFDTPAPTT